MSKDSAVTLLLGAWQSGDPDALEKLTPMVYEELRRLARRYMSSERADHTLQATALVNEAFLRLAGSDVEWANRAHFYAIAARMMRRILIDHAKANRSGKRGGGALKVELSEEHGASQRDSLDILEVDRLLNRMAELDARKADVLALHYFGGLTYDEISASLDISAATVDRDLRLGKAWLHHELENS
ncbi:ECF-type sigma factor [Woeseia oceani]|uniref:RNA polymerase subunit sigma-70 n=1 Tax=Woeseia oceani TaxID=1548547 RepID=A0A193LKV7_9GAMM|nr:ECF-type sigma factor [Woeseia oceani]ANO53205.1 RNA polymerase subunit sigma-70 [Woeseia oceani]